MDIFCTKWVSPHWFTSAISQQLIPGVKLLQAYLIEANLPSLQSQLSHIEYKVRIEDGEEIGDIESKINSLLSMEHLPWQHQRDTGMRTYDLRALIDNLWLIEYHQPYCTIGMRLRCDNTGSGRPEQVTAALGFLHHPRSVHRTKLILKTN
jgi:hypothetical protein